MGVHYSLREILMHLIKLAILCLHESDRLLIDMIIISVFRTARVREPLG